MWTNLDKLHTLCSGNFTPRTTTISHNPWCRLPPAHDATSLRGTLSGKTTNKTASFILPASYWLVLIATGCVTSGSMTQLLISLMPTLICLLHGSCYRSTYACPSTMFMSWCGHSQVTRPSGPGATEKQKKYDDQVILLLGDRLSWMIT